MQEQGFTFAKASVYKAGETESDPYMMQARGIYNVKLAVFETEESGNIVPNDMDFDRNRRVYILSLIHISKRALNPWFKVSPPARSARGMRSP